MPKRTGRNVKEETNYDQKIADKIFSGDKGKYENLSLEQKRSLIKVFVLQENNSSIFKEIYPGTLEEFAHLPDSEQERVLNLYDDKREIFQRMVIVDELIQEVEKNFQEMKICQDEKEFNTLCECNDSLIDTLRQQKTSY